MTKVFLYFILSIRPSVLDVFALYCFISAILFLSYLQLLHLHLTHLPNDVLCVDDSCPGTINARAQRTEAVLVWRRYLQLQNVSYIIHYNYNT